MTRDTSSRAAALKRGVTLVLSVVVFAALLFLVFFLPPEIVAACANRSPSVTENDCVEANEWFASVVRTALIIATVLSGLVAAWLTSDLIGYRLLFAQSYDPAE